LIDANTLMTPYQSYYPFDFAPKFWYQLESAVEDGSVVILDMVKKEVEKGNDLLSEWIKSIRIPNLIDHREKDILDKYSEVLRYIQTSESYSARALQEWSQGDVADAWLIATALVHGYTIITFEASSHGIDVRNPSSNPKIPDVCAALHVKCEKLFYMMRTLSFMLE